METQRKTLVRLLALALGIAGASEALAATRYFDCLSGNMQTASCWSSNIKPVAGDIALIGYSSYASNVTATLNSGSFAVGQEYIGHSSYNGEVSQLAGTHTVSFDLVLAANSGISGAYYLRGGSLIVNGAIMQGSGNSSFYIAGGSLNVGGGNGSINVDGLVIGSTSGASHTLSGSGTITTQQMLIGYAAPSNNTGSFTQAGGTNSVTFGLQVGTSAGGIGSYVQTGGINTVNNETIGYSGGIGTYTQSGGTHTVNNLSIGFTGTGTYNLQGGNLVAGTIHATGSTANFNFTGGTLVVSTFNGNLVNNGGILAPGASPGTSAVQGDYTQGATGALGVELGGTGAGLFDVLQVTGVATLAGDLDVTFWNGFSAAAGDSFDIVSATNLLGGFDTLNLATLGTGLVWSVDYLYDQDLAGTDYVRLSVQAVPEAETYAMMLAGLGLVGWAARRKQAC